MKNFLKMKNYGALLQVQQQLLSVKKYLLHQRLAALQ